MVENAGALLGLFDEWTTADAFRHIIEGALSPAEADAVLPPVVLRDEDGQPIETTA